jgi:Fe-Mn family superoxide dismutase
MPFELPKLPYAYDALEPYIDAQTMEIHYTKHHNAYVTNLNKAIIGTDAEKQSVEEICKNISRYSAVIRNNAGGHYNHSFFWKTMKFKGGGVPSGDLAKAIEKKFGSFEEFKTQFAIIASTRFGSGWAWLCVSDGKLSISSTPNQDNPLMDISECMGQHPILALDVWEHAYYLHYQNKRPDYIAAFWNVVDWDEVSSRFKK